MAFSANTLVLTPVTAQEAQDTFNGLGLLDKVTYSKGANTYWYLWGDPPIGHAALIKMGSPNRPSSHWRLGRVWIKKEARGSVEGFNYAGITTRHALSFISAVVKKISIVPWSSISKKHQTNGWQYVTSYNDGSDLLHKIFTIHNDELYEIRGDEVVKCTGIFWPGDVDIEYIINGTL